MGRTGRVLSVITLSALVTGSFVACQNGDSNKRSGSTSLTPSEATKIAKALSDEKETTDKMLNLLVKTAEESIDVGNELLATAEIKEAKVYGTFDFLGDASASLLRAAPKKEGDQILRRAEMNLLARGLSEECSKVSLEMLSRPKVVKGPTEAEKNPSAPRAGSTTLPKNESGDTKSKSESPKEDEKSIALKVQEDLNKRDSVSDVAEDLNKRTEIRIKTCGTENQFKTVAIIKRNSRGIFVHLDLSQFPELTGTATRPLLEKVSAGNLRLMCQLSLRNGNEVSAMYCKNALYPTHHHSVLARFSLDVTGATRFQADAKIYDLNLQKAKLAVKMNSAGNRDVELKEINADGTEKVTESDSEKETGKESEKPKADEKSSTTTQK